MPFLLCVQHRHLDFLKTRLMAALIEGMPGQPGRLNPKFTVVGRTVFLDPTNLAAVNMKLLKSPVANLASESFRITAALDLVFTGV